MRVRCPYCCQGAEWVENRVVYGKNLGKSYMIWLCRDCDAYVGCHQNSRKPLGTLAKKELREARVYAHEVLDEFILNVTLTGKRKEAYTWLKESFGKEIHIGSSDMDTCDEIVKRLNKAIGEQTPF